MHKQFFLELDEDNEVKVNVDYDIEETTHSEFYQTAKGVQSIEVPAVKDIILDRVEFDGQEVVAMSKDIEDRIKKYIMGN